MLKKIKIEQSGRTIVEMLAYISLMITITASFATLVGRGYHQYESSLIQQELVDLKKTISERYAVDGNYANLKWDDLCEDNIGPRTLMPPRQCIQDGSKKICKCKEGSGAWHAFGGPVIIGAADNNQTFYITFQKLPQDICGQLGVKNWSAMEGSDLDRMSVNGRVWAWPYSPVYNGTIYKELPATVDDVINACNEGRENEITWYFN